MDDVFLLCGTLKRAYQTLLDKTALLRGLMSSTDTVDKRTIVAKEVEEALVECKNAVAIASCLELTEAEVRRAGLTGGALSLFLGEQVGLLEEAALLAAQAVAPVVAESASLVSFLIDSSVEQCVEVLERCCVSSFRTEYPNWVNVKAALFVVESLWGKLVSTSLPLKERPHVVTKLRVVRARVFSSKWLRCPTDEAVAMVESERAKSAALLGAVVDESPVLPEFQVALEIAQDTLRVVLRRFCWMYRMEIIEGDGNCFFRAIVRALTPHVPRDHEDMLSLQLRKLVNDETSLLSSQEIRELKAFEETDETDSKSMVRAGVWADHIQIAKTAALLGRCIMLLRCDDLELRMGDDGLLHPSDHYVIGNESAPSIALFYQSSPGHFETLVPSEERTLSEALNELAPSLLGVCDCFFRLESIQSRAEDERSRARSFGRPTGIQQEAGSQTTQALIGQLSQFRDMLKFRFVLSQWREDKAWPLFGELADSLVRDANGQNAFGPLQMLTERVRAHAMYDPLRGAGGGLTAAGGSVLNRGDNPLMGVLQEDDPWPVGMYSPTTLPRGDRRPVPAATFEMEDDFESTPPPLLPITGSPPKVGGGGGGGGGSSGGGRSETSNDISVLLGSSGTLETEWEKELLLPSLRELSARNVSVAKTALSTLMSAATTLGGNKKLKGALHLVLEKCRLDDECCQLLMKPARHISLIQLRQCVFNDSFKLKFNIKQHIQLLEK